MIINQLCVFLENRAGRSYAVAAALASAGVDIEAYAVADMREFGVMRLVVSDVEKAKGAMADKGMAVIEQQVLCVPCPNETGALARVLGKLSDEQIQVEYMYAFVKGGESWAVVKCNDLAKAEAALK